MATRKDIKMDTCDMILFLTASTEGRKCFRLQTNYFLSPFHLILVVLIHFFYSICWYDMNSIVIADF